MPPRLQSSFSDIGDGYEVPAPSSSSRRRGKDKESFGCPYPGCGQSYSRMEYLKRHQRKHQDDRPFQCKDCSKAFARSDVLLRHRRRCHPTPPPADRSSHSPLPQHRSYPGVPVSSSRNDYRELSPEVNQRKHSRQNDADDNPRHVRQKLEDEDEYEDDERFGEGGRYGRHNGMGNGGVYNGNNFFTETEPSYTPHLLSVFQQNQGQSFQNPPPNDSNHLEDASVLLSMAYPSGVPSNGNSSNPSPVEAQPTLSDWETGQQTINAMMEAAHAEQASRQNSGSIESENANIDPVFSHPPNLAGPMDWLTSGLGPIKDKSDANAGWLTAFDPSPQPLSPFPLSSLFSPSTFGISVPNSDGQLTTEEEANNANNAVMSILDQLAMYDTPQTRANPNPERPLLRLAKRDLKIRAGKEISTDSRFFIDADRFSGCYTIPHWALPPLKTLSLMANRTFDTVLKHFSFVHMPTFRLTDTAACLAFAICTIGGIKNTNNGTTQQRLLMQHLLDGPVPPGQSWESIYKNNYQNRSGGTEDVDMQNVTRWDNAQIVRNEKSNMLVKSFSLARGVLMTEYNVGLLQALIMYNAPYFLSEDEGERHMANLFLGTIVNITRQIGFFNKQLEHHETEYQLPHEPHTPNDLDLCWRRWIQLETRRRTAYLVYHLDTISALESNITCIIAPCEISDMLLPAPDSVWQAPTAEAWLKAVKVHKPMTLDEAMRRIFFLPTYGAFDTLHERADTKYYNLLNESELGPFARLAMVLTLLRGIIDIGEGKRDRGDWRDLTDLWIGCSWLKPGKTMLTSDGKDMGPLTQDGLRKRFNAGLQKWREGWDFDPACSSLHASSPSNSSPNSNSSKSPGPPHQLNYCEEALPFYWLAQALINLLNAAPPNEPGWNTFSSIRYGDMLKSARTFTRMGEGIPSVASTMISTPNAYTGSSSVGNGHVYTPAPTVSSIGTSSSGGVTGLSSQLNSSKSNGIGVGSLSTSQNAVNGYSVQTANQSGPLESYPITQSQFDNLLLNSNNGISGMNETDLNLGSDINDIPGINTQELALALGMNLGDLGDLGNLDSLGELGF